MSRVNDMKLSGDSKNASLSVGIFAFGLLVLLEFGAGVLRSRDVDDDIGLANNPLKSKLIADSPEGLPITLRAGPVPASPSRFSKEQILGAYSERSFSFEANYGQVNSEVKFLARTPNYTVFLTLTESVWVFNEPPLDIDRASLSWEPKDPKGQLGSRRPVLRMKLVGSNSEPRVEGLGQLPSRSNYFAGSDSKAWHTNVPQYAKIRYGNIYAGVNLIYYEKQRLLEYDFVLAPGSDPDVIRLSFEGLKGMRLNGRGDLVLSLEHCDEEIVLHKPTVYQDVNWVRQTVSSSYEIGENQQVGFRLGEYDRNATLVIDPALEYSTYLGNRNGDYGAGITVDSSGNAYVTGTTASVDFPTALGTFPPSNHGADVFVAKLDPQGGGLAYSTYLIAGGPVESSGIAVDSSGNAYVTGFTASKSFPVSSGAVQALYRGGARDAFVTKLNAAGNQLIYSTYLGGSGDDRGMGIAVDSSGNAFVTGNTDSSDFVVTMFSFQYFFSGLWDVFATKLNASGSSVIFSTYLGGVANDLGNGIAVDTLGAVYLTGVTMSPNFPITLGAFQATSNSPDAFVAKLNPSGSVLLYSTYLGGRDLDWGMGIAVDSFGSAYVTGFTWSNNFPTTRGVLQISPGGGNTDAFVTKLNGTGASLLYSTYLGGSRDDFGIALKVDTAGNAYVTGNTYSNDFPTSPGAVPFAGSEDVFMTKLDISGANLLNSIYVGGRGNDQANSNAIDSSGNAYVIGTTGSVDFPATGRLQPVYGGGLDAFVTKILAKDAAWMIVVNAASYSSSTPVAPGSVGSVFGAGLATISASADSVPLPATLAGVTLRFNGIPAPLLFVSPNQINFQVPWELAGQRSALMTETVGNVTSSSQAVNLTAFAPAIFSTNGSGGGQGAILISSTGVVAAASASIPGRTSRAAVRGEFISIYCTGMGPVMNQPATGAPALADPLSFTTMIPSVTVGGFPAPVRFSGLAPASVGLYQVDVPIPADAPSGDAVPISLSIGGVSSNIVTIAVQ